MDERQPLAIGEGLKKKKNDEKNEVNIFVVINSQYKIFDQSGSNPFNIVFGLCRRQAQHSPDPSDGKPILFEISESVFDVPYALKTGLLHLYEGPNKTEVDVCNMIDFDPLPAKSSIYTLHPKPNGHRTQVSQRYMVPIDVDSQMARLLKPKTSYVIRLDKGRLGVKWWAYGDAAELLTEGKPTQPSESSTLTTTPTGSGRARFQTIESLPVPPLIEMHMRLLSNESGNSDGSVRLIIRLLLFVDADYFD